ncbi:hypothetical protein M9Y10_008097 [Tritrichomonas musculus]|uniref:Uncharacterized protein n=1 Tax=Tritrichomonas musculus TaxID=1915356 RepID=A0ABR2IZJ0_9EUKA
MNSCFNTNEVLNEKDGRFDHSQSESTDSDGEIQSSNLKINGFRKLINVLPTYEYEIPKPKRNQKKLRSIGNIRSQEENEEIYSMNRIETDNNRFVSYYDAFSYVAKHCQKYHSKYTRENCRQYLKDCYIIDFSHDEFIPIMAHLSKRDFNKYFSKSQRELKYL